MYMNVCVHRSKRQKKVMVSVCLVDVEFSKHLVKKENVLVA